MEEKGKLGGGGKDKLGKIMLTLDAFARKVGGEIW